MRKQIVCWCICFAICAALYAQGHTIARDDVSVEALKESLISLDAAVSIDSDGDLRIEKNGIKLYARLSQRSPYISFFTVWSASSGISESRASKVMNAWNADKIFGRVSYKNGRFWLEYELTFVGGIHQENLIDTVDWLFLVADAFNDFLDDEDAI